MFLLAVTQFLLASQVLVVALEETTALVLFQELQIKMVALAEQALEHVAVVAVAQVPLELLAITTLVL
jgi:hypothetical protein